MCQNHTGNTITQEDLNALAALAGYTLPGLRGRSGPPG